MKGKTEDEVRSELKLQHMGEEEIEMLLPHKVFQGGETDRHV